MALPAFTSVNVSLPSGAISASQPFPCTHDWILPKGPFLISHVPITAFATVTANSPVESCLLFLRLMFLCLTRLASQQHMVTRGGLETRNPKASLQLQHQPTEWLRMKKDIVLPLENSYFCSYFNCQSIWQAMSQHIHLTRWIGLGRYLVSEVLAL